MKLGKSTLRVTAVINALAMLASCAQPKPSQSSRVRDLAANKNAKNIALIFGAENDLPGVERDVISLNKLFQDPTFGFQVTVKDRATSTTMIQESGKAAASLDEDSTMIWYYSGHGSEDGSLFAEDQQSVYMRDVINAMAAVRKTPFKRLIVVIDSCFSGQNVDGTAAILSGSESQASLAGAVTNIHSTLNNSVGAPANNRPFEQAIILAAARSNQTSSDAGDQMGGVFTYSWRTTIAKMLTSKTGTIGDMLTGTIAATRQNGEGDPDPQVPVFRASPQSILNEPLVGSGSGPGNDTVFHAYVALAGSDPFVPMMQISVPQAAGASTMIMCAGDMAACRQSPPQNSPFAFTLNQNAGVAGRTIFTSQGGVHLQTNTVYSLIFRNLSGAEVGVQAIRATSH